MGVMHDAEARRAIKEDLDDTLIVEAAAGTGKTTELVNRILRVLETGRATMVEIVAVTFTEKAAGELKLRLREELERARQQAAGRGQQAVLDRFEAALKNLEEAHLGTIHGFCAELLRERPVEAGVDPLFTVLTEAQARRLYEEAFGAWFQEILEDAPDTVAVIAAIGGGGLVTGVGSALKARNSGIKVWGAEPETAAPVSLSLAAGSIQEFKDWRPSFVDGAGGQGVFPRMWERMRPVLDGCIVVTLDETKRAMRMVAEKARVIAEGAGALAVAAALTGKAGRGPVVAVVSGGNVDLPKFCELISSSPP